MLFAITVYGQSNNEAMTNASVINLYTKGLSPSIIVSKIKTSKTNFDVSIDSLLKLKDKQIPDEIINLMVELSGNKSVEVVDDANDPNSNHESGIYYYKPVNGKFEMLFMEPTVCSQTKMGGALATALTYGIAKTKMKAVLNGEMAQFQLNDSMPVFYFYFENVSGQGLNNSSAWFSSSSSPNEFILMKMDVKKKSREFVTGSYGAYGGSSTGIDEKYKVDFTLERLKKGVYKVTPKTALIPGEYCFLYAGSVAFLGASGKVYDFRIAK